jgi:outer membrane receptor protein involved in Fe transport
VVWDAHGNLDVEGPLATDRPHVAKVYGAYSFRTGTDVGVSFYAGSGTPVSTYVNTTSQAEVFVNGRGDMGRTPVFTQTNLLVSQAVTLAPAKRLRLELNVINLFNQKTTRHLFNYLNRGAGTARASAAMDLSRVDLAKGYDYEALIRATPDGAGAFDPRYGMGDLFNEGLQGQVMVKFTF